MDVYVLNACIHFLTFEQNDGEAGLSILYYCILRKCIVNQKNLRGFELYS